MHGFFNNQTRFYSDLDPLRNENLPDDDEFYILTATSSQLPISFEDICVHLKLTIVGDKQLEDYYTMLTTAVTKFVEKYTWRDIQRKTWEYFPTCLPCILPIRKSPLISVDSIEVFSGGVFETILATDFNLKQSNIFPCIVFKDDADIPDADDDVPQPFKVTLKSGDIDTSSDILNDDLKIALLQIIASLDQYRGDCIGPASTSCFCELSNVPPQALAVLNQYKIMEI